MANVIGIDLGTSNTVVAHVDRRGKPRAIADESGSILIPSIVSFLPSGKVVVGAPAKERRFNDPENTIFGAKRLMGRTWVDPELQEIKKRLPYELRRGKNESVRVMLRGELYTLPEIAAFVLRRAKTVAEAALGDKVGQAVITVPANFNEPQRAATKLAGSLADLDVVRVLNEPTAAALAYGYDAKKSEQIAVYDFGGGTFDLTLLTLSPTVLRVRATAGDMFLGGDDIDVAIANAMAIAFLKKHHYDARAHGETFDRLRVAAEGIKMQLSKDDRASVEIDSLMHGPGGKDLRFAFSMTRAELEILVEPFAVRTLEVCKRALSRVRASPNDFDRVVLVGGTTRIPLVRQRVVEFFGRDVAPGVNPDEAVALGAAIQGLAAAEGARERKRLGKIERTDELSDADLVKELLAIAARTAAAASEPIVSRAHVSPVSSPTVPAAGVATPRRRRSRVWALWVAVAFAVIAAAASAVWLVTTR